MHEDELKNLVLGELVPNYRNAIENLIPEVQRQYAGIDLAFTGREDIFGLWLRIAFFLFRVY
jgi:hypothetical protein